MFICHKIHNIIKVNCKCIWDKMFVLKCFDTIFVLWHILFKHSENIGIICLKKTYVPCKVKKYSIDKLPVNGLSFIFNNTSFIILSISLSFFNYHLVTNILLSILRFYLPCINLSSRIHNIYTEHWFKRILSAVIAIFITGTTCTKRRSH